MFIKPFKLKSNIQIRSSDVKKLRDRLRLLFPNLTEDDVQLLLPAKSTITLVKITTSSEKALNIYAVDKRPMFFEDDKDLIPTVYAMWIFHDLLPFFTTHPAVLAKLCNGADLMLPGVVKKGSGLGSYGNVKKDQLVAVNLTSNQSAVGVGRVARSSYDLYMSGGIGPCVKMLHVFGDKLWSIEPSVTLQIPAAKEVISLPSEEDFPPLGAVPKSKPAKIPVENPKISVDDLKQEVEVAKVEDDALDSTEAEENIEEEFSQVPKERTMDDILKAAFFTALKFGKKDLKLPLLTSNFYRLHVIPAAEEPIDLKKTEHKKLSNFLSSMEKEGYIVVREENKGIEKIISINFDHPDIVNFIPERSNAESSTTTEQNQLFHAQMAELYAVTDETKALFAKLNFTKDDRFSAAEIKKMLKEYIRTNKLATLDDSKMIALDETLLRVCGKDKCSFDEIYRIVLSKMHHSYEMRGKNELSNNKPPVRMSIATRSGNKKVTLVSNLENYGIIMSEFVKTCKIGAAASTTIVNGPNQKENQLQIQGNQIRFLYNLLTETYKIPAKSIIGLDLAKKEKKKRS